MQKWLGLVLTAVPVLFLSVDAVMKVLSLPAAVTPTVALGYSPRLVVAIGLVEMACLILYVVPRTAPLGAILLTGYLGGAVASQLRAEAGAGNVLFPVVVGLLLWAAIWVRDPRVRAMFQLG